MNNCVKKKAKGTSLNINTEGDSQCAFWQKHPIIKPNILIEMAAKAHWYCSI